MGKSGGSEGRHGQAPVIPPWAGDALFTCPWSAVEVNGVRDAPLTALQVGLPWSWHGHIWRLDALEGPLRLEAPIGHAILHRVMAARAARLVGLPQVSGPRRPLPPVAKAKPPLRRGPMPIPLPPIPRGASFDADGAAAQDPRSPLLPSEMALGDDAFVFKKIATAADRRDDVKLGPGPGFGRLREMRSPESLLRTAFVVTDGVRTWQVSVSPATAQRPGLAVFLGAAPPRDTPLRILQSSLGAEKPAPRGGLGFGSGTLVETPGGPVPVERLRPGQEIVTDAGPKRIRAFRRRRAARAIVIPPGFFEAAGPDQPVLVGREVWIGLEGRALHELFSLAEALVRAGDLETQPGVRLSGPTELFMIATDETGLIMAGGLPFLCGQAQDSPLRPLSCGEAQITLSGPPGQLAPRMAFRGAA